MWLEMRNLKTRGSRIFFEYLGLPVLGAMLPGIVGWWIERNDNVHKSTMLYCYTDGSDMSLRHGGSLYLKRFVVLFPQRKCPDKSV